MKESTQISDLFVVYVEENIYANALETLVTLYQPFVGYEAIQVYITLWKTKMNRVPQTFHGLLDMMQIEFDRLYGAFQRLEAAKLITTYHGTRDTFDILIYQLNSPETVADFLKEPMFVNLLASHKGNEYVNYIRNQEEKRFAEIDKIDALQNVSAQCKDVFKQELLATTPSERVVERQPETPIQADINNNYFFDTFYIFLAPSIKNTLEFNFELKQLLEKIATLYQFTSEQMVQVFNKTYQKTGGQLTEDELRHVAYELSIEQLRDERTTVETPVTGNSPSPTIKNDQARRAIEQMKSKTSKSFIELLTGSFTPKDAQIIEKLTLDYQMTDEVINVLLNYVYKSSNGLSWPLTEAIAQQWVKTHVSSAEEAYFALNEFARLQKERQVQKSQPTYKAAARRTEIVPEFEATVSGNRSELEEEYQKLLKELEN